MVSELVGRARQTPKWNPRERFVRVYVCAACEANQYQCMRECQLQIRCGPLLLLLL